MLTIIPEQIKPDIAKIKAYMHKNYSPTGVAGVTVTEGKEEFSYKIKEAQEEYAGTEKNSNWN